MKNNILGVFTFILSSLLLFSCADHDDPTLYPIDTQEIEITANIANEPSLLWFKTTEGAIITVDNLKMSAPKGVVIESVYVLINNYTKIEKPYSGDRLEFQIPLSQLHGKVNFAVLCKLIKKDCRDAEYLIKDNINITVFNKIPEISRECKVDFTVTGQSTTGEILNHSFSVTTQENSSSIIVPESELYWVPKSGDAQTINVKMICSLNKLSSPDLNTKIGKIYWNNENFTNDMTVTIPNQKGSLKEKNYCITANTTLYGDHEGVAIETPLLFPFLVTEK